jgi:Bacterial RNA polymerase, alpha chain C terminal domain
MQMYSDFFKTLHDETGPTGRLGRGTHYSVLRAIVFQDHFGKPLAEGQFADFAVIWDEDHDTRVLEPIEQIYSRGLLSSFLMFGEQKGCFTAVLSNELTSSVVNPVFSMPVDELESSVRVANCFRNNNIVHVGDLVQRTEGEMLRVPNFGRDGLNEVKKILAPMKLDLGMKIPGWPSDVTEEKNMRVALLKSEINNICQSLSDPWPSKVVSLESQGNPIISDDDEKVSLYLKNLDMLWELGT